MCEETTELTNIMKYPQLAMIPEIESIPTIQTSASINSTG